MGKRARETTTGVIEMADEADIANDYVERQLQSTLNNRVKYQGIESALYCEDCGDRIPDARREAVPGCQSCRDCAEINEMANSR